MITDLELLDRLLDGTAEALDISPKLHDLAVSEYERIAVWLVEQRPGKATIRIYPQGSFRLGTVVRPHAELDEYDIDLVFMRDLHKTAITQADLKAAAGEMLTAYVDAHRNEPDCPKLEERGRCWTLTYDTLGFHLDVLPTIPDHDGPTHGVLLTDRDLFHWQYSNPIGYASWFRGRETDTARRKAITAAASRGGWSIDQVPEYVVRTPLQRLVQILKRQRDIHFGDDLDNRPPSILLTTLAAQAFNGEDNLYDALRRVLARIPQLIENRNGTWWVPNPAHSEENFADKWNTAPERRTAFLDWMNNLSNELESLSGQRGLDAITASLGRSFGESAARTAAGKLGQDINRLGQAGGLGIIGTKLAKTTSPAARPIPPHTFRGPR